MGVSTENSTGRDKSSQVKIVNERISEYSLSCTCDSQPFACEACDFTVSDTLGQREAVIDTLGQRKAVIRQRFRTDKESLESLKTSAYDALGQGWIERDPETTQTFKRKQQVRDLAPSMHHPLCFPGYWSLLPELVRRGWSGRDQQGGGVEALHQEAAG